MTPVPWHIGVRLPGGRVAVADYRDPVAGPMHQINRALSQGDRPAPILYEQVAAWLDEHAGMSQRCHAGLGWHGPDCGHD